MPFFPSQTHCDTIVATLRPLHGTAIPVFYYHFPAVYNDDFPLLEMLESLRKVCPNLIGAKISGVSNLDMIRAVSSLDGFGVLGTGIPTLTTRPRGWICYPWEAPAGREFVECNTSVEAVDTSTLAHIRSTIGGQRVAARPGACVAHKPPCIWPTPAFGAAAIDLSLYSTGDSIVDSA